MAEETETTVQYVVPGSQREFPSSFPGSMLLGMESELGIMPAQAGTRGSEVTACLDLLNSYANAYPKLPSWCYAAETPLRDIFMGDLDRRVADPSQLTDYDPTLDLDPNVDMEAELAKLDLPLAPCGGHQESAAQRPALRSNVVTTNGGRFYVDHAHPEVSTPECWTVPALIQEHQKMLSMVREAQALAGNRWRLFGNNVDGKGSTWGHHENYRISREVDFGDLAALFAGHLVSRQVYCGAGRLGVGSAGAVKNFQISQRADYVECLTGLQTTFNRPLINTRDEAHDDASKWRRLHVIVGDFNQVDYSTYLRVGSTSLVLWALERRCLRGLTLEDEGMALVDAVLEVQKISHDTTLTASVELRGGQSVTALELAGDYLQMVAEELASFEAELNNSASVDSLNAAQTLKERWLNSAQRQSVQQFMADWEQVLVDLGRDLWSAADRVEWVAKYQLLERARQRYQSDWSDPRLFALDLAWADLNPQSSPALKLAARGSFRPVPGMSEENLLGSDLSWRAQVRSALVENPVVSEVGWAVVRVGNLVLSLLSAGLEQYPLDFWRSASPTELVQALVPYQNQLVELSI
ncbi:hypothetical protein BSR29_04210 [Boudabousia liubingyangii]|uniref:Proteasome accessory factor PafA2 n=1 Tax=Boudabousia liubingyangii TaxID=1921764 RepID=A0A1Q5PND4_9ACTO|nr:proteasome accessory factor PafA2 family protein [Boudabousia liubingyangii]OKL49043.1 hypothetical protein BSR29_04210 [Boudabousia liubingyangii]